MAWCFAIVNNKLAEIYFNKTKHGPKIWGHCYVKKNEYKTKQEYGWIKEDTAKLKFIYRMSKYRKILRESNLKRKNAVVHCVNCIKWAKQTDGQIKK